MAESDIRKRIKASNSKDKISMGDKTRNGIQPTPKETSLFKSIIELDVYLTSKTALCANSDAKLGSLRPVMIFLEWSCHGLPWTVGPILGILISHDAGVIEILMNILLGKNISEHISFVM